MILFILPVKNESKSVAKTARKVKDSLRKDWEALFIDDGSDDATFEVLYLFNHPRVKVVKNKFDNGKGSALKAGCVLSEYMYKLKDNDLICFLDGDGQIDPKEIDSFLKIMKLYNSDVVIGNKRHIYSTTKYTFLRRIVSVTYNKLINCLFDFEYRDTQCGIKLFKKSALESVIHKVNTKRYAFDLELIVALRAQGYRIADAPVSISKQINRGSISLSAIIRTFVDTIKVFFKKIRGDYE